MICFREGYIKKTGLRDRKNVRSEEIQRVIAIDRSELDTICQSSQTLLIDLREPFEYKSWHLEGAKNFPYDELEDWKTEIPPFVELIFYCEYGNLSLLAARKLKERPGKIYTLIGGVHREKRDKMIDSRKGNR